MAWHAPYANTTWGWPVALVVPPTAHMQTHYSWGVPSATMTPAASSQPKGVKDAGMIREFCAALREADGVTS